MHAGKLLEAVSSAERERAAAPDETPLGKWTAFRVKPNLTSQPLTTQLQLGNSSPLSSQVSMQIPHLLKKNGAWVPCRVACNCGAVCSQA